MSVPRTVLAIDRLPEQRHGGHLVTRDASIGALGAGLDPFLMVSLYAMRGATFPPHPHAGFMVATYILPESDIGFLNQDSLGTRNRIAPGSLHVTVAGRGVLHEEQPEAEGRLAQGFQIWIDLPSALRDATPHALHLDQIDVPVVGSRESTTRVVLGDFVGVRSPLTVPTQAGLLDVDLQAGAHWTHVLRASDHAFAYVHRGALQVQGQTATPGTLVRTRADGDVMAVSAGPEGARFTVFCGQPMAQPRVMRGPFVANDEIQLARYAREHAAQRWGSLRPMGRQGA